MKHTYRIAKILASGGFVDANKVTSNGAIGDMVAMLPTLKHRAQKTDIHLIGSYMVNRLPFIRPFFISQPYIGDVVFGKPGSIDWASENFRVKHHVKHMTLAECHARHAISVGFIEEIPDFRFPWVTFEPDRSFSGKVIVQRTPRYNNNHFPWRLIVQHYADRIVFFGNDDEHNAFVGRYGFVRRLRVESMLHLCQAIGGCSLVIANQSMCAVLAEGMKVRRILECDLRVPDCIYSPSDSSQYVFDGMVLLPEVDGSGTSLIAPDASFMQNGDSRLFMALRRSGHEINLRRRIPFMTV